MPQTVNVIDNFATPPLGSLVPVRDTNGPFVAGVHTFTTFHTDGSYLLPSGTYDVHGTYGVIATFGGSVPATWGVDFGYTDGSFFADMGLRWENRWAQVVAQHELFSGAWLPVERLECHYTQEFMLWPFRILGGDRVGLWVAPDITVDLFYLCVL